MVPHTLSDGINLQTTDVIRAPAPTRHRPSERSSWEARVAIITVLVFGLALSGVLLFALQGTTSTGPVISTVGTQPPGPQTLIYPAGIAQPNEPSALAPPGPNALAGYQRSYFTDFLGRSLPRGWQTFTGVPGGDPTAKFAASHVIVGGGMLRLVTYRDPAFHNRWTSGGLCQCRHPMKFGAFFVRSRISNAGPNEVALLWPANNQWPPEIDFNESGSRWNATSGTVHHGTAKDDRFVQQNFPNIDLRSWHTWGVIWTSKSITYTVDGEQWGYVLRTPGVIPQLPMTLDLQQRPGCAPGVLLCPPQAQTMYVDWVAEFTQNH